ncbi:MAG: hypothetical protein GC154_13085 [bacterium]|nr:hypothetical protein [bacterium]
MTMHRFDMDRRTFFIQASLHGAALALASCGTTPRKKPADEVLDRPPAPLAAGQTYVYQHEGPRPFGDGLNDASGRCTVTVLGRDPEMGNHWVVEERFEHDQGVQLSLIDDKYLRHMQGVREEGSILKIEEKPPAPVRYIDWHKNQKKTTVIHQTVKNEQNEVIGEATTTDETQRLYDYRVVTPMGAILCRHFVSNITIEANLAGSTVKMNGRVESYWSDGLGWFVQKTCQFKPMTRDGAEAGAAYQAQTMLVGADLPGQDDSLGGQSLSP